jgi:hypothetical protein
MLAQQNYRSRLLLFLLMVWVLTLVAVTAVTAGSGPYAELLGLVTFETGFMFGDTKVGGLSGITYDGQRGVYYAHSDDRSQTNLARYYTVDIVLADGSLSDGDGTFLAMERSFAVGVGNTIRLYEFSTDAASDVSGLDDLYDENTGTPADFVPVQKELVLDLADVGVDPDNVEGTTFGPTLPDGRSTLILVSDNNFNLAQVTQFIAPTVALESVTD